METKRCKALRKAVANRLRPFFAAVLEAPRIPSLSTLPECTKRVQKVHRDTSSSLSHQCKIRALSERDSISLWPRLVGALEWSATRRDRLEPFEVVGGALRKGVTNLLRHIGL